MADAEKCVCCGAIIPEGRIACPSCLGSPPAKKGETMYQSPISIYETAMETIIEHRENAIFAKVQDAFDVQVDKKELIRALQYDRGQYEKGFQDGVASAEVVKWIPVSERMPERFQPVIICRNGGKVETGWRDVNDWWRVYGTRVKTVTHWMPLPEAPEVEQ